MKWLISKTNSVWGLKKNGRGIQFYSHVVNFPNDTNGLMKDAFLNNFVFTSGDYKNEVKQKPEKAYRGRDANSTSFRIDVSKEYPNISVDQLLNHDFAVSYDEKTDKYMFWAITGQLANYRGAVNPNIIDFEATRDWMFELGIENLFDEQRQVEIMRAHIKDVVTKNGKQYWNIDMESDNAFVEKIEEFDDTNYQPTKITDFETNYVIGSKLIVANNKGELYTNQAELIYTPPSPSFPMAIINNYYFYSYNSSLWIYDIVNKTTIQKNNLKVYENLSFVTNNEKFLYFRTNDGTTNYFNSLDLIDFSIAKISEFSTNDYNPSLLFLQNEKLLFLNWNTSRIVEVYDANTLTYIKLLFTSNVFPRSWTDKDTLFVIDTIDPRSETWKAYNYNLNTLNLIRQGTPKAFNYQLSSSNIYQFGIKLNNNILVSNSNGLGTSFGIYYPTIFSSINTSTFTIDNENKVTLKDNVWYLNDNKISSLPSIFPIIINGKTTDRDINKVLGVSQFGIINCQLKNNFLEIGGSQTEKNGYQFSNPPKITFNGISKNLENNYYTIIMPLFNYLVNDRKWDTKQDFNEIYNIINSSPYVYKITINQIPIFNNEDIKISYDGINIIFTFNNDSFVAVETSYVKDGVTQKINDFIFKKIVKKYDFVTNKFEINKVEYDKDLNKGFIEDNIAKLHRYPYKRDYVKTTNDTKMFIMPQLLTNLYSISLSYSWGLENEHFVFKIVDNDNQDGIYNSDIRYNLYYQDINNFSLIQTNSPYEQYLIRNRDQLQQKSRYNQKRLENNETGRKLATAGGIMGMVGGLISAGTSGMVGSIASGIGSTWGNMATAGNIGGALSGMANTTSGIMGTGEKVNNYERQRIEIENDIEQQKAMLQDLQNSPNSLTGNGSDLNMWVSKSVLNPIKVHEELWPTLKKSCAYYLHLFGSNLSGLPKNVNEYLNNKYYFNFIQTKSVFENYKPTIFLNNQIRQINDLSLRDGITIWHIRKLSDFKGIKNYNVNNIDV